MELKVKMEDGRTGSRTKEGMQVSQARESGGEKGEKRGGADADGEGET